MKKILLGQLYSNGDCLYATAIARQIKTDFPGCHLTWAINTQCAPVLEGNPYVDDLWLVELSNNIAATEKEWKQFEKEAMDKQKSGEFNEVFLIQTNPGNLQYFDGTIRSSIFRAYPRPITVPIAPVIRLSPKEVENVRLFAQDNGLEEKAHVILFECAPKSGQSLVTPIFALHVAKQLISTFPNLCVILSSNICIASGDERIIDGSVLSFRENAELTKYCTLLIGCSSGISWLCTSDWAKPLPMIQIINPLGFCFASFIYDHEYWDLPTDDIIEMANCSEEKLVECVNLVIYEGFESARSKFNKKIIFNYYSFVILFLKFARYGEFAKIIDLFKSNYQRHGITVDIIKSFSPGFFRILFEKIGKYFLRNLSEFKDKILSIFR